MMERNWLIRTSQNQILGPVAKAKVLEFLQKGALGLNDEVTSGNGYWFSLKEKSLVEKYLHGDVPQGYNPISESKSVLSRRENPDLTTSLNTAPANKTQVLKAAAQTPGVLPANDDLEYPDLTMVNNNLGEQLKAATGGVSSEEAKLPTQDDLEFPDIVSIAASIENNPHTMVEAKNSNQMKSVSKMAEEVASSNEPIVYPQSDDLAYPDMASIEQEEQEQEEEDRDFTVVIPNPKGAMERPVAAPVKAEANAETKTEIKPEIKKVPKKDFKPEFDDNSGLSLVSTAAPEAKIDKAQRIEAKKIKETHIEDKKLLHERKVKASTREAVAREMIKSGPKETAERAMPDHLKKRNDNYLMYVLVILVLIILSLFFYYYRTILNKPLPV